MIPEYIDDGALHKQDKVDLDEYLKATDRAEDWPAAAAGLSEDPPAYSAFRQAATRAGLLILGEGPDEPLGRYKVAIPSFGAFLRGEPPEPIQPPGA